MNAAPPEVALLVAAHNCQDALNASIRQLPVDEPLHILIVDDASAPQLLAPPCDPLHVVEMVRNKVSRTKHGALRRAAAMAAARGFAYVARLDPGDIALPGRFRLQREFLDEHSEVAVVGSACRRIDGDRIRQLRFPPADAQIRRLLLLREQLCPAAVMMRAAAVIAVGNYRTCYPGAEDRDLFLRLMSRFEAANLQEPLIQKGKGRGSAGQRRRMIASVIRLQLAHLRAAWRPDGAALADFLGDRLLPHRQPGRPKLRPRRHREADGGEVAIGAPHVPLRLAAAPSRGQQPEAAMQGRG
ncbi:MAG: glycosyltransferase [Rhodospirillales bacterium]